MQTSQVHFSTFQFRASHCREPKGFGSWWFQFEGREFHTHAMTFTEARKACVTAVKAAAPEGFNGVVVVEVMP